MNTKIATSVYETKPSDKNHNKISHTLGAHRIYDKPISFYNYESNCAVFAVMDW